MYAKRSFLDYIHENIVRGQRNVEDGGTGVGSAEAGDLPFTASSLTYRLEIISAMRFVLYQLDWKQRMLEPRSGELISFWWV